MALSNPIEADGENGFIGLASRENPVAIPSGYVQTAKNIRFDRGVASTRKGSKRLTAGDAVGESIFVSGAYSGTDGVDKIVLVGGDSIYIYNTSTEATSAVAFPTGRTIVSSDKVDTIQANDRFYILRGESDATAQVVTITSSSTTATVTKTDHGYSTGDEVTITGASEAEYNGSYVITVTDANEFTYTFAGSATSPATGTIYAQSAKPPLYWDGDSTITVVTQTVTSGTSANFPPADFGFYFNNRIVVRRQRDKIAVSDYFDFDTWDLTFNQWSINLGANDYLTGFLPWQEDKFALFERNSIYYAYIDPNSYESGPGENSYIKSLTSEIGCNATKSIVNAGENIFFLSDLGVYTLTPSLDLKLLGNQRPLSEPINDIIERINVNYVQNAVGAIYNSRYYLAVPLDSSVGAGDATTNNGVLVYSMLNNAWESVDEYPSGFSVDDFVIALYGERKRLYATNSEGVFLLEEEYKDEYLQTSANPLLPFTLPATINSEFEQTNIAPQLVSRRYIFNSYGSKRFASVQANFNMNAGDAVSVTANVTDPDSSAEVLAFGSGSAEDFTKRARIGKQGYGVDLQFDGTTGRPTIRGFRVEATVPGRKLINAE